MKLSLNQNAILWGSCGFLGFSLLTGELSARPEYHADLLASAETTCRAELCIACHTSANGGGPSSQPFFIALLGAGYSVVQSGTMSEALDELEQAETDSDDDGVGDVDEVMAGTDPNSASGTDFCGGAEFGCLSLSPTPRRFGIGAIAWVLAAIGAWRWACRPVRPR